MSSSLESAAVSGKLVLLKIAELSMITITLESESRHEHFVISRLSRPHQAGPSARHDDTNAPRVPGIEQATI